MIARIYLLAVLLATLVAGALLSGGCAGPDVGDLFGAQSGAGGAAASSARASATSSGSSSSGGVGDCLRSPSGSYCACTVACAAALGIPEGTCFDGTPCEPADAGADVCSVCPVCDPDACAPGDMHCCHVAPPPDAADGGGCVHDECTVGLSLVSDCSPCAAVVCMFMSECCLTLTSAWGPGCVQNAIVMCGLTCPGWCPPTDANPYWELCDGGGP